MKKRLLMIGASLLCLMLTITACASGSPSGSVDGHENVTLKVYNWAEYIDENVLHDFEQTYPWIKVEYNVFTNNEEMLTQIENDPTV